MKLNTDRLKKKIKLAITEDKGNLGKLKSQSLQRIGDTLIAEIKQRIASGISPITGKRFAAYKNPKRYPGKQKPKRPVNLWLSGDFIKSLRIRVKTGKNPMLTVYFTKELSEDKERGHRDGAKGQPKRPIIPVGREGFADGILVAVRQVFRKVIDKDLS